MNKYYKLTNLLILITLVFGSFFVWKEQTNSQTPDLKIVTAEGNSDYLKTIELYGYLSNQEMYSNDESFKLEENKISYLANQSIVKRLDSSVDPLIDYLVENYRSFMRGKYPSSQHFILTDDFVIYAAKKTDSYWKETATDELVIAVLNKDTAEEQEFSLSLSHSSNYYELYTSHFDYPKITMVLSEYPMDDQVKHVVYEFNIETPEVGLTEVYDFTHQVEMEEYLQVEEVVDKTSRYIPFRIMKEVNIPEVKITDELARYVVYDIKDNRIIDIPLFDAETLLLTDRQSIYVAEVLGTTLHLSKINPKTEALEELGDVQLNSVLTRDDDYYLYNGFSNQKFVAFEGKLYNVTQEEIKGSYLPSFQIVDLESQDTLFSGRLDQLDKTQEKKISIGITNYWFR